MILTVLGPLSQAGLLGICQLLASFTRPSVRPGIEASQLPDFCFYPAAMFQIVYCPFSRLSDRLCLFGNDSVASCSLLSLPYRTEKLGLGVGLECRYKRRLAGLVCCRVLPAEVGVIVNPTSLSKTVQFRANVKVF